MRFRKALKNKGNWNTERVSPDSPYARIWVHSQFAKFREPLYGATTIVELPDAEIRDTGLTASLAKIEVAVALYRDRKVSLGHGARIAHLPTPEFLQEVGRRNVAVNYDVDEFDRDLREIENL
jgi:predicted HTH domain antitoxin